MRELTIIDVATTITCSVSEVDIIQEFSHQYYVYISCFLILAIFSACHILLDCTKWPVGIARFLVQYAELLSTSLLVLHMICIKSPMKHYNLKICICT
jgi:hypothetical protein